MTGEYRYRLDREIPPPLIGVDKGWLVFCMLNPSTATDALDDPTIRRCKGFAQSWGFSHLEIVNLFAMRSTDPKGIYGAHAHVSMGGQANDDAIKAAAGRSDMFVAAWGVHGKLHRRDRAVLAILRDLCDVYALGTTADGSPRHPLYVPGVTLPVLHQARGVIGARG